MLCPFRETSVAESPAHCYWSATGVPDCGLGQAVKMSIELHRSFRYVRIAGPELQQCSKTIYTTIVKNMTKTTLKDLRIMYR